MLQTFQFLANITHQRINFNMHLDLSISTLILAPPNVDRTFFRIRRNSNQKIRYFLFPL